MSSFALQLQINASSCAFPLEKTCRDVANSINVKRDETHLIIKDGENQGLAWLDGSASRQHLHTHITISMLELVFLFSFLFSLPVLCSVVSKRRLDEIFNWFC